MENLSSRVAVFCSAERTQRQINSPWMLFVTWPPPGVHGGASEGFTPLMEVKCSPTRQLLFSRTSDRQGGTCFRAVFNTRGAFSFCSRQRSGQSGCHITHTHYAAQIHFLEYSRASWLSGHFFSAIRSKKKKELAHSNLRPNRTVAFFRIIISQLTNELFHSTLYRLCVMLLTNFDCFNCSLLNSR